MIISITQVPGMAITLDTPSESCKVKDSRQKIWAALGFDVDEQRIILLHDMVLTTKKQKTWITLVLN